MSDHPVIIGGHSLGAQRAYQYAYSRIKRGLRVDGIYCLAPPQPGNKVIGQVLWAARAQFQQVRALKNLGDYVTTVPENLELLGEEFAQPWTLDEFVQQPSDMSSPDPYHNITLYQAGARTIPDTAGAILPLAEASDWIAKLYDTADGWDWISTVDGAYAAMKILPSGVRFTIYRGTKTIREWLQDFDAFEIEVMGAKMPRGGWAGVAATQDAIDAAVDN